MASALFLVGLSLVRLAVQLIIEEVHAYSLMACTKAQAKSVFPVAREPHASLQAYTRMQRCMRAPIAY
jgi:hypothetical protein